MSDMMFLSPMQIKILEILDSQPFDQAALTMLLISANEIDRIWGEALMKEFMEESVND